MKKRVIIFLIILFPFKMIFAGNFEKYLDNIKNKIPEIKLNKVKSEISKNKIYKIKSIDDIFFTLNGTCFNLSDKQVGDEGFIEVDKQGVGVDVQFQKKFSFSGTILKFGSSFYDKKYTKNAIEIYDNVYEPSFYITFSQPLLYNIFGIIDRYTIEGTNNNYKLAVLKEKFNNESILNYYSKIYFNLMSNYEILSLIEKNIILKTKLYKQVKEKASKGLVDYDDVEKALFLKLKLEEKKSEVKNNIKGILVEISDFTKEINLVNSNDWDIYFSKSTNKKYKFIDFNNTTYGKTLTLSLTNLKLNEKIYKNKKLPELNLSGTIRYENYSPVSISDSYAELDKPEFLIGIEFKKAFGDYSKKADLKESTLKVDEGEKLYQIARKNYNNKLKKILNDLEYYKNLYKIKEKNIESLLRRKKIESEKYNTGRLGLSFLIETENSIIQEKIEVLLIKLRLIQLYFDYILITS